MKIAKLFIMAVVLIASYAQAAEESAYVEVARLRQYVGGRDESDLKVQPFLSQSSQSKKKNNTSTNESVDGF